MAYLRTAGDMLEAVRDNLDERNPSFWLDDQIYRYLTRAADSVHTECRKLKADYHLTGHSSLDGILTIFGESYDTAQLRYMTDSYGFELPPDLLELKLVECITPSYEWVTFDLSKDMSHPQFRALRQLTTAPSPTAFLGRVGGDRILNLTPKTDIALDLRITYVSSAYIYSTGGAVHSFTLSTDTFTMPFPLYQAVEQWATAYAHLQDRNPQMAAEYEKRAIATCQRVLSVDARQIQDPEFVLPYDP